MLSRLATYTLLGIEARSVEVEVDISPGSLPKTILVGLAEAAVKESIHRIERALVNSGYGRPMDRVVINLSPADLPKDAAALDLPIALGLLISDGQVETNPEISAIRPKVCMVVCRAFVMASTMSFELLNFPET